MGISRHIHHIEQEKSQVFYLALRSPRIKHCLDGIKRVRYRAYSSGRHRGRIAWKALHCDTIDQIPNLQGTGSGSAF